MKLTDEQKAKIRADWGDWEGVHCDYDDLMRARLRELDPEFYEDLEKAVKGATFWYA